ncbi:unnamed protein product [Trichogramma brassicae]|uniref:EGF-like domain-containing protein n=1 Tax=Trichogramma brassicae TaxID=86971 RepID=A0A6H5IF01_9HYME|nr:unnamed protein product [Trichogramma brassicae]
MPFSVRAFKARPLPELYTLQASSGFFSLCIEITRLKKRRRCEIARSNKKEKSLYFADGLFIWSVNYSGKNKRLVATTRNHVTNLVFSAGKLFFTTDGADGSTAMSSCSVSNGVCSDITDTRLPGHIVQMKAYNFADWLVDNPCHYGSCEQMCLLNANQNYTCACKLGWRLASDEISCEKIHEYLIYRQNNYFRGIILNSTMNQFKKAFEPIKLNSIADGALTTFDYDARKNVVVFADLLTLRKLDLTSGSEKFFLENLSSDGVLALDWLSGKIIYVRDDVFGGRQRIVSRGIDDFSETDSSVVLYDDFDPFERVRSLTVHPVRGLIFFTIFEITSRQSRISQMRVNGTEARSFFILRATMDGRYPKIIYSSDQEISALSIERKSKRLYFFVNGDIESIDFNGHYNRIVTKFENETNPIVSLTAYDNKLFWARDNESVYWTCITHIGACDKFKPTSANTSIIALKAYDFSQSELPNGCLLHECEHMCIVATNGAQSCMCNTGWRLKDDEKSCERVDEYLIYLHNDVVSGKILSSNQHSFAEAMLPFKFNIDKTLNLSINFDLDTRRNSMIISDSSKIYEIKLNRTHEEPLVLDAADRPSRHIAVDWISNIYYYISTNDESLKNFIKVRRIDATYDSTGHRVLMEFDISIMPMEIVAHPNRGYVFFIESNNKNFSTQIGRIHSDGSELIYKQRMEEMIDEDDISNNKTYAKLTHSQSECNNDKILDQIFDQSICN